MFDLDSIQDSSDADAEASGQGSHRSGLATPVPLPEEMDGEGVWNPPPSPRPDAPPPAAPPRSPSEGPREGCPVADDAPAEELDISHRAQNHYWGKFNQLRLTYRKPTGPFSCGNCFARCPWHKVSDATGCTR